MALIKELQADRLTIKKYDTRAEMGKQAARETAEKMKKLISIRGEINMVFAAAPSQNEFIQSLISDPGICWDCINAFHMDEYIGLPADAPQGFGNFLRERLFSRVPFKSVHYLNGGAADIQGECMRYSNLLKEYHTDIVCLGVGENGHIAFNDPPVADFSDPVLVKAVRLDPVCRGQQVNDGCFATLEQVPTHALTLTISALTQADYLFCVVPAKTKCAAVTATVRGEIGESCPATILRRHNCAVMYVDSDSGANL